MYKETIGLMGGFGGFATLDFFRRLLETFNTGRERDYPRVVMDNDFTMPSRTRALLYDEEIDQITEMMATSMQNLINIGADKIILVCGTAHWFLDGVYKLVPQSKEKVIDIIETVGEKLQSENVTNCYVIAAEGTMLRKLYNQRLAKYNINVFSPEEADWPIVRSFIEATKQNKITASVKQEFAEFIQHRVENIPKESDGKIHVILGCTELPPLVNEDVKKELIFDDPLENVLLYLKKTLR